MSQAKKAIELIDDKCETELVGEKMMVLKQYKTKDELKHYAMNESVSSQFKVSNLLNQGCEH